MKYLLWIVVIWMAIMWYLHQKKLAQARRAQGWRYGQAAPGPAAPNPTVLPPEKMLCCAHCGVHLPSSEALVSQDGQLAWCCSEHRARHPA